MEEQENSGKIQDAPKAPLVSMSNNSGVKRKSAYVVTQQGQERVKKDNRTEEGTPINYNITTPTTIASTTKWAPNAFN